MLSLKSNSRLESLQTSFRKRSYDTLTKPSRNKMYYTIPVENVIT